MANIVVSQHIEDVQTRHFTGLIATSVS